MYKQSTQTTKIKKSAVLKTVVSDKTNMGSYSIGTKLNCNCLYKMAVLDLEIQTKTDFA